MRSVSPILYSGDQRKNMTNHRLQRSVSATLDQENTPPSVDPNVMNIDTAVSKKNKKKGLLLDKNTTSARNHASCDENRSDSNVKVAVRIRPVNSTEEEGGRFVWKVSPDSLMADGKNFKFSSVFGSGSTQDEVFQLVGAPIVKDSLEGFNASLICYGETGSGKTYTMWGPLSAMLEDNSSSGCQGLAPRIFHMLFSGIQNIKERAGETYVNFQCRCSFLEIYNEQISDLLDPFQRNLQVKDDNKNGFYVENLSEEYVTNTDDVIQILVKGLSNRRVGATSVNPKSSRSHVILTCIIESWCKSTTSNAFSNSKTSRISFVDLAGSERNVPDGASVRYKKEGKHIKKSMSKLGKVVNTLAKMKQSETKREILYADSCLTNLLRDSFGGNAKATVICAVSPGYRCKSGTLSTLRFGQQAVCIENEAVMNEITEDVVNDLTDQIRELKEELIKEKTSGQQSVNVLGRYFKRHNVRGSLNLLRASLNRSMIIPDFESNLEDEIDNGDATNVEDFCNKLDNLQSSLSGSIEDSSKSDVYESFETIHSDVSFHMEALPVCKDPSSETVEEVQKHDTYCNLSVSIQPSQQSLVFDEPTLSTSPTISSNLKKSFVGGQLDLPTNSGQLSFKKCDLVRSSLQSRNLTPTDSLAASLHRGLQIIDYHQRNSFSKNSSVGFSFDYLKTVNKIDGTPFYCASCKQINSDASKKCSADILSLNKQEKVMDIENKADEAIRRASELEVLCSEKEDTIKQLIIQVEQYKQEIKQMSSVEQKKDVGQKEMIFEGRMHTEDEKKNETLVTGDVNDQRGLESEVEHNDRSFDITQRNALLAEIQDLKSQLQSYSASAAASIKDHPLEEKHNSLLQSSIFGIDNSSEKLVEDFEEERSRWLESESRWISLTEELRMDLQSQKTLAEKKDLEIISEKNCSTELDDALQRCILAHVRMVEHFSELQENYTSLHNEHRRVMAGIAQVRMAAEKAGKKKCAGRAFAQALNAELSTSRAEKENERLYLKEQNKVLKIQIRDTAEAVHAAGELLVKLREAEESAAIAEDKYVRSKQETEKYRKQMEKLKRKHNLEIVTMKHYMDESRLPECALVQPQYDNNRPEEEEEEIGKEEERQVPLNYDTQSWRSAFEPSYR